MNIKENFFEEIVYADQEDFLEHYGTPRHSGRYPYGSGEDPFQGEERDFAGRVQAMRKEGVEYVDVDGKRYTGDTAIAKTLGMSTTDFRSAYATSMNERKLIMIDKAESLKKDGKSDIEIGRELGVPPSTVHGWLQTDQKSRSNAAMKAKDSIKSVIDEKGMIEIGKGVAVQLGISEVKMKEVINLLNDDGYPVYGANVPQATNPGKFTKIRVACPPGTEHKEIYNFDKINSLEDYTSYDNGDTLKLAFAYPKSMDIKRLKVRYADETDSDGFTGQQKDGVIELRRGVKDISLGDAMYSQVRILVDNDRYLKGMAVYSDDMPKGVDVVFNTNKKSDVAVRDVLKKIKDDPENPFGSAIKEKGGQSYYIDKDGKEQLSLINKRADQGDWSEWKDKIPSQFLAKQPLQLINRQLNLSIADKNAEYEDIIKCSNPTVRKKLLQDFADDCDTSAKMLSAAALPEQKYHVILPINTLKDTEVYAPRYKDGEQLALVRYPHAGTFEIPVVTVNNKNSLGRKILGNYSSDAIGINSKVAERLSGADFDGDSVMAIPTGKKVNIKSTPVLPGLDGFDPKIEYARRPGMKIMTEKEKQIQMGVVSNLITDMTLAGADRKELARAVKHSMVVIDAEKHKLDYKRSEQENGIAALKKKYQGYVNENGNLVSGASTILSRAKSPTRVPKRIGSPYIDSKTGDYVYKTDPNATYQDYYKKDSAKHKKGEKKFNKDGTPKMVYRTTEVDTMSSVSDAFKLVRDPNNAKERAYALYANALKDLSRMARKTLANTSDIKYDSEAAKLYKNEVESIDRKLKLSRLNAPKERFAQIKTAASINQKKRDDPEFANDKEQVRKTSQKTLTKYRTLLSAKRQPFPITDKEWAAIQAGAISGTKLREVLTRADVDDIRSRATPRSKTAVTPGEKAKIKAMQRSGYTLSQIADSLGKSTSTISKYINEKE